MTTAVSHPRYSLAQQLPANPTHSLSSLQFSSNGSLLAASAADGSVRLYSVLPSSTAPISTAPTALSDAHEAGVNEVAFSSDDRQLCTASDDKTLVVWDVETSSPIRTLRGHSGHVFCCSFSPSSALLLSGSYDETVKLWDLRQSKPARTLATHTEAVTSVRCHHSKAQAVSSSYDGLSRVWDLTTGALLRTIYAKPPPDQTPPDKIPPVSASRFTPNGKFLLSSYLDGKIRLWNYEQGGECVRTYEGHFNAAWCCATGFLVTYQRKYLVGGSEDGRVYIWDITSREVVQRIDVGNGGVVAKVGGTGAGVCVAVSCHPTRHVLVTSVTVEPGQASQLSVFTDNDTETVITD